MPLVECVPNFSEGRRPDVINAIVKAISNVDGVMILDQSSDRDHNRSVITFAGNPDAVLEGAYAGIARAAELIDMDQHRGVHPRLGATDVVPLVPLEGIDLETCAVLARQLGRRVAGELGIPVYLYEAAALLPERVNLANVRRGEYETLKAEIATSPERLPDFGEPKMGKAGATIIGARHPLIAYNVYLNTDDVLLAQRIARTIRASSGGLPFVKALGLLVNGQAQVSMNLTDYRQTPLASVMESIRQEAARHGVAIDRSELIGLIPEQALLDAAAHYLELRDFSADQTLERRLRLRQNNE